jgi:predicted lipoprotein with Yx(FWY)xxD motif
MKIHGRLGYVVLMLAAVTAVSACGSLPGATIFTPVAATAQPRATQALGSAEPAVPTPPPVPEPTVAKIQKWVKIYSGPSRRNIVAPKSIRAGSHDVELNATLSTQFGTYVSDGAGRTLYRFDKDTAQPPKSNCNGDCAVTWPPLLIKSPGKIFPKGLDPKILGYVERADGHCQVTINGWPVYYYSGDKAPSEFRGQGLGGVWFAVTPTGGKTRNLLDGN